MPFGPRHSLLLTAIVAAIAADVGAARGDEPRTGKAETIVVKPGERAGPRDLTGDDPAHADAGRALDEPAFVTVVRIDDRRGETATIAEVLARTVGVHVRSLGGLGGFSSMSVRGGAPGHTAVSIDGVPLSQLGSAAMDLGRFELQSFSEMELYRGGVPVALGGAAIAGALDLQTRVGPQAGERFRLSTGAGSFGARHVRGRWLDGNEDLSEAMHVSAGYAGARGDYSYYDDNGTNLDTSDDAFVRRRNNGYDQVDSVIRYRFDREAGSVSIGARSQWKQQGVPGLGTVQSTTASLTTFSQLADASGAVHDAWSVDGLSVRASGYAMVEHQRYRDLDGEIGLAAQDRRYLLAAGGGSGGLAYRNGRHRVASALDLRGDAFSDRDLTGESPLDRATGGRWALGVSASDEISLGPLSIEPALRVDFLRTYPISDVAGAVEAPMDLEARTDLAPSPRVSARWLADDALSIKSNVGLYFRSPTALELFGDRGFIVGNPALEPERGVSADVGAVFAPAKAYRALDRLYLEVAAFGSHPFDAIAIVPNAGLIAGARNLGGAWIAGAELTGSVRAGRVVTLAGNYTLLATRQDSDITQFDGKELPQRPRHQLYARADVAGTLGARLAILWGDVTFAGASHPDPANLEVIPARTVLGAGAKLELLSGLLLGIEGKNLTDARIEYAELDPAPRPDLSRVPRAIADFFGYPLPGRAFYLTLDLEI